MVYALGEVLLDIIIRQNGKAAAVPGGAVLNSAISLAHKGIDVSLISEIGNDNTGNLITNYLKENKINTSFIQQYPDINTSLALAFLDENAKPDYTFYKRYPDKRSLLKNMEFKEDDILVFASFYSIDPAIRKEVVSIIEKAKKSGSTIIYDPNIRHKHHLSNKNIDIAIKENLSFANWIKGSDEDFTNIFGEGNPDIWFEEIRKLNDDAIVIITLGDKGSVCYTKDFKTEQPAQKVKVVSTVGAGDAFGAGMIYGFLKTGKNLNDLTGSDWKYILEQATKLSADVCKSELNYV